MANKFEINKFDLGRGSERWVTYDGKFVARFKYGRPAACAKDFVKFLIANFTVDEYFAAIDNKVAPSKILESKGYVGYNTRQAMKAGGYSTKEEMIKAKVAVALERLEKV